MSAPFAPEPDPRGDLWTDADREWLLANFPALGPYRCAVQLERTPEAVRAKYQVLRRQRATAATGGAIPLGMVWTDAELLWLIENADKLSPEVCADHLRRTVLSVKAQIDLLGLARSAA